MSRNLDLVFQMQIRLYDHDLFMSDANITIVYIAIYSTYANCEKCSFHLFFIMTQAEPLKFYKTLGDLHLVLHDKT